MPAASTTDSGRTGRFQRIPEDVPGFDPDHLHCRAAREVNQSSSVADFSIMKCGEEIGVLEVTRFTIQEAEEIRSLIQKNPFIERTHCESDWHIHLGENARINDVRKCADRYLRDVELSGIDCFFSPIDAHIEPVRRIWEDLCVESGAKTKWRRPGIGLSAPSSGGLASSDGIWKEVQPEVYKSDNRRKLGQSVGSNRHLFVVIDGLQGSAYVSIRRCEPPQDVPDLPSEITHLWLAAEEGALVYVWLADSDGWQNFTDVVNGNT